MNTFTGAFGQGVLTRAEVITLHTDNVAAIRRRIGLIRSRNADDPDIRRVISDLEADVADQLELTELARCGQYPYELAPDTPEDGDGQGDDDTVMVNGPIVYIGQAAAELILCPSCRVAFSECQHGSAPRRSTPEGGHQ